jgi:hypothetical protein
VFHRDVHELLHVAGTTSHVSKELLCDYGRLGIWQVVASLGQSCVVLGLGLDVHTSSLLTNVGSAST